MFSLLEIWVWTLQAWPSNWSWCGCRDWCISSRSSQCLWDHVSNSWYGAAFCDMLNPMSVRSSIFCILEWESGWLKLESVSLTWIPCVWSAFLYQIYLHLPHAACKISLILSFSSSTCDGMYLGEGTCGRPSWMHVLPDPAVILCRYSWLYFHNMKPVLTV